MLCRYIAPQNAHQKHRGPRGLGMIKSGSSFGMSVPLLQPGAPALKRCHSHPPGSKMVHVPKQPGPGFLKLTMVQCNCFILEGLDPQCILWAPIEASFLCLEDPGNADQPACRFGRVYSLQKQLRLTLPSQGHRQDTPHRPN